MHLPLTGHPLSLVHQQHWMEPPHWPWLTSHVVLAGQALLPPRLQKGATTEHPALSVNWPPVQLLWEVHLLLRHPPLFPMSVPRLLHSASAVHAQY